MEWNSTRRLRTRRNVKEGHRHRASSYHNISGGVSLWSSLLLPVPLVSFVLARSLSGSGRVSCSCSGLCFLLSADGDDDLCLFGRVDVYLAQQVHCSLSVDPQLNQRVPGIFVDRSPYTNQDGV